MDEAESLLRQALALQRQRGGKPDKNALIAMGNLGSLLIERGELEEGKALHLTVWETSRRMFGDDHVITLIAGSKAAQTLYRCDDFEGSLEILLPVLDGFRQLNGPDHQSTINIHRLMAKCYRKLDDSQSEQEHLETALAAAQKHPEALEGTIRKIKRDLGQGQ